MKFHGEIYALDDHVKVKLEVYIGDLDKYKELIPDEWLKQPSDKRPSLEKHMQIFATKGLQFITDEGVDLLAKLKLVRVDFRCCCRNI